MRELPREPLLSEYLPPVIRQVLEIETALEAQTPEVRALWVAFFEALDDQFIHSANDYGLSRWEKILKLAHKDSDTLEDRRFRILLRLSEELPYTWRRLINMLHLMAGEDNYQIALNAGEYILKVRLGLRVKWMRDEMQALLLRVVPCNLVIDFSLQYNTHGDMKKMTHRKLSAFVHGMIKEEVLE